MSIIAPTDELFESFLMKVCTTDDWENTQPARVYVRTDAHGEWLQTPVEGDPYEVLPAAVAFTIDEQESMLFMYGWATKVSDDKDPDDFDIDEDLERVRVRILLHITHDKVRMAVQFQGKMLEEQEDMGTGMFPDTIRDLRNQQKGRELS